MKRQIVYRPRREAPSLVRRELEGHTEGTLKGQRPLQVHAARLTVSPSMNVSWQSGRPSREATDESSWVLAIYVVTLGCHPCLVGGASQNRDWVSRLTGARPPGSPEHPHLDCAAEARARKDSFRGMLRGPGASAASSVALRFRAQL